MKFCIYLLICILGSLLILPLAEAGPSSTNYQLQEYSFGAGGSDTSLSSTNYKVFGTVGEAEYGSPSSALYSVGTGLIYTLLLNTPPAPTLSNPATNYDRLKIVLNQGGNKSDTTYAIAISTDNFVTNTKYVKSDNTVGTTLTTSDFKTYSNWGGASGFFVTGLANSTTYYVRAKAKIGNFTETGFGPASPGIATSNSSITFSLDSSSLTFDNLNAANSYTDSAKTTVLTTSTNAYNGYIVYAKETQNLTSSTSTIANFSGTNASPTTWSGNGFGYNTSDTDLQTGGTANRFSGSKYAGFTTTASDNPIADHLGPIQSSAISNEQFTISYKVTTSSTQNAGNYTSTIQYIVVGTY